MEGRSARPVPPASRQQGPTTHAPGQLAGALESAVGQAAMMAGAVAGTVGLLYVIGGAVMWLRFNEAGLPADRAVALVPKADLLVLGLRVMVIPALASAALLLLLASLRSTGDRPPTTDPLDTERPGGPSSPAAMQWGRALLRRYPIRFFLVIAVALAVGSLVPFSLGSFAWPVALSGLLGYWLHLRAATPAGERLPVLKLAVVAIIAASFISVARQTDRPVDLVSVRAEVGEPSRLLQRELSDAIVRGEGDGRILEASGILVALTERTIHIGDPRRQLIASIPRPSVTSLTVGPPLDQQAPPRSLLSRVVSPNTAWAVTPLEIWCHNVRYGWMNIWNACRGHPRLDVRGRLRIVGDRLTGIELACPSRTDFCRGFVIVKTESAPFQSQTTRALPLEFRPTAFAFAGGERGEIGIPVDDEALWDLLPPAVDRSRSKSIAVVVSVSLERLGKAVVEEDSATLIVTGHPDASPPTPGGPGDSGSADGGQEVPPDEPPPPDDPGDGEPSEGDPTPQPDADAAPDFEGTLPPPDETMAVPYGDGS